MEKGRFSVPSATPGVSIVPAHDSVIVDRILDALEDIDIDPIVAEPSDTDAVILRSESSPTCAFDTAGFTNSSNVRVNVIDRRSVPAPSSRGMVTPGVMAVGTATATISVVLSPSVLWRKKS